MGLPILALEKFGFGPNFLLWIKLQYSTPSAVVLTNGMHSHSFNLQHGTRQGCPLSPLLFALAIEPLAIALHECQQIVGVTRRNAIQKVTLYADDLLLYISNKQISLSPALTLLENFGRISGYKLNLHMSELFPINMVDKQLQFSNIPLKIVKNKFTYLGFCITHQHKQLFKHNFGMLLERTKKDLSKWSPLRLSLIGRINSIKMTVLPKFLYLFQSLPLFIPLSFFKSLDSVISTFIWNGKHPRLKKAHLQKSRCEGGMSLPNFKFYY